MTHFLVTQSPTHRYAAMVFAASVERPHANLASVAKELKRRRVSGCVLFDLLIANGARSQRFFAVDFDGSRFVDAFEPVQAEPEVAAASARFLAEHADDVDTALLTPAQRFALKRGVVLASA
ncbi:MAG: hypothetical protein RIQ53_3504 [Pseudomonadota bacterium]|jgi:hypothetical protein